MSLLVTSYKQGEDQDPLLPCAGFQTAHPNYLLEEGSGGQEAGALGHHCFLSAEQLCCYIYHNCSPYRTYPKKNFCSWWKRSLFSFISKGWFQNSCTWNIFKNQNRFLFSREKWLTNCFSLTFNSSDIPCIGHRHPVQVLSITPSWPMSG